MRQNKTSQDLRLMWEAFGDDLSESPTEGLIGQQLFYRLIKKLGHSRQWAERGPVGKYLYARRLFEKCRKFYKRAQKRQMQSETAHSLSSLDLSESILSNALEYFDGRLEGASLKHHLAFRLWCDGMSAQKIAWFFRCPQKEADRLISEIKHVLKGGTLQ